MKTTNNNDFIDLDLPPYLGKAEAVRLLDKLYLECITENDLHDVSPDFRTLIDENVRSPEPPSAIKSGFRRGNRRKYGAIRYCRNGKGRILFLQTDLEEWFYYGFAPHLKKVAA